MSVKASAIELLEVFLEETNENSKTLAQEIAHDVSVEDITSTMEEIWVSIHYSVRVLFIGGATPPDKHCTILYYYYVRNVFHQLSHTF